MISLCANLALTITGFQALRSCASYSYRAWQGNLLTKYIIDWFLCWMHIIICLSPYWVEKLLRVRESWAKVWRHVRELFSIVFYFYNVDEFQHKLIKSGLTVWLWKYTYMAIYVCVNILLSGGPAYLPIFPPAHYFSTFFIMSLQLELELALSYRIFLFTPPHLWTFTLHAESEFLSSRSSLYCGFF